MILRRVIDHFRKQEWTAIAIDFIIVVLGVFVGLQVQEWSGRQEDKRQERRIVEDMLADLDIDRPLYAEALVYALRRVGAADALLKGAGLAPIAFSAAPATTGAAIVDYSFDVAEAANLPAVDKDRLWADLALGFHPTPSTTTYDALIGAGDTRIIRDRNIMREIQLYRNNTTTIADQNRKILSVREDLINTGALYGLAPFDGKTAEEYFEIVGKEPQLAAAIRIMATFVIFHKGEVVAADTRAAELQKRLRDYLETIK